MCSYAYKMRVAAHHKMRSRLYSQARFFRSQSLLVNKLPVKSVKVLINRTNHEIFTLTEKQSNEHQLGI